MGLEPRLGSAMLPVGSQICSNSAVQGHIICWGPLRLPVYRTLFVKKGLLQKSEGKLSERTSDVNFAGDFWWIFSGDFPLNNPRQNSHQNFGASRPKSTLQGSSLDSFVPTWKVGM